MKILGFFWILLCDYYFTNATQSLNICAFLNRIYCVCKKAWSEANFSCFVVWVYRSVNPDYSCFDFFLDIDLPQSPYNFPAGFLQDGSAVVAALACWPHVAQVDRGPLGAILASGSKCELGFSIASPPNHLPEDFGFGADHTLGLYLTHDKEKN